MTQLAAGTRVTLRFFSDVPNFAEHEGAGNTPNVMRDNVRTALQAVARDVDVTAVDVTRGLVFADVASGVVRLTPTAALDTAALDAPVLSGLNARAVTAGLAAPRLCGRHRSAGEALSFGFFGSWNPTQNSIPGIVVSPEVLAADAPAQPQASASVLGRIAALPDSVRSTEPARDNRTVAGAGAGEISPTLLPTWYLAGAIGVAVLVGVIAIGYAARGIASAVHEAK